MLKNKMKNCKRPAEKAELLQILVETLKKLQTASLQEGCVESAFIAVNGIMDYNEEEEKYESI